MLCHWDLGLPHLLSFYLKYWASHHLRTSQGQQLVADCQEISVLGPGCLGRLSGMPACPDFELKLTVNPDEWRGGL